MQNGRYNQEEEEEINQVKEIEMDGTNKIGDTPFWAAGYYNENRFQSKDILYTMKLESISKEIADSRVKQAEQHGQVMAELEYNKGYNAAKGQADSDFRVLSSQQTNTNQISNTILNANERVVNEIRSGFTSLS